MAEVNNIPDLNDELDALNFNTGDTSTTSIPGGEQGAPDDILNATSVNDLGDKLAIIGYIAPQKNAIKKVDISKEAAKASWEANKDPNWASIKLNKKKTDGTLVKQKDAPVEISYKDEFSMPVFKTFMQEYKKAEYDKVLQVNSFRIDMSEARVDRYILRLFKSGADSVEMKQLSNALVSVTEAFSSATGTAVLTKDELLKYVAATDSGRIPVVTGMKLTNTVGYLSFQLVNRKKDGQDTKEAVVKIYDASTDKPMKIRALNYKDAKSPDAAKVPYCVLKYNTTPFAYAANVTESNIENIETFKQYFPGMDATKLSGRKKFSAKDYEIKNAAGETTRDTKRYNEDKEAQKVDFASSGAEAFGIQSATWSRLQLVAKSSSKSQKSSSEQNEAQYQAIEFFKKQRKS